jgi:hypothetical protein
MALPLRNEGQRKSSNNFQKRAAALDMFYSNKVGLFVMVYTGTMEVPEDALPNGMVLVSLQDLQGTLLLSPDAENSTVLEADGVARGHRWVGSEAGHMVDGGLEG